MFSYGFLYYIITSGFTLILLGGTYCYSRVGPCFIITLFLTLVGCGFGSRVRVAFNGTICIFNVTMTYSSSVTSCVTYAGLIALFRVFNGEAILP